MKENLDALTDEELIQLIYSADASEATDILMDRYKEMVRSKARTYFLIGADRDDVVQEGMIGLYKAIRNFRPEKAASFHSFAELCVTRQIVSAIRISSRQKHSPLNQYVSLNQSVNDEDGKEIMLIDLLPDPNGKTPEEILTGFEEKERIEYEIEKKLSPMEKKVLTLFLEGMDYTQIAQLMDKPPKSIDNALQRVKRKIMNRIVH